MPGLEILHQVAGSVKSVILQSANSTDSLLGAGLGHSASNDVRNNVTGLQHRKEQLADFANTRDLYSSAASAPSEEEADWVQVGLAKGAHANQGKNARENQADGRRPRMNAITAKHPPHQ